MKKSLLILPLAAALLSGCLPGKKTSSSSKTGPDTPSVEPTEVDLGPDEYQGYKRVTAAPADGKEYIMGMYQATLGKNMFYNGGPHTDSKGEYEFYLSCTEDVTKATKIKIEYTDDTHFTMKDNGGGEKTRYTGQYLRVYESVKGSGATASYITSLSFYDGTEEGAKHDPGNDDHVVERSNDKFHFVGTYQSEEGPIALNTFASEVACGGYAEQEVILGTYDEYISIGAVTPNHFSTNFLTFLWEKI